MGQALRKLEQSYERYAETRKNRVHSYLSQYSQLKNNNNDYYINIIKNKSNALKEYLSSLDQSNDLNYEEAKNEGVQTMNGKKYTVKEVAEILAVSTRTVEKYISTGKLAVEWGKGKTGKIRLITSEALQAMKENEAMKYEDMNYENSKPVDNSNTEIIEPEKYLPEPQNNFVTREELNYFTAAITNFTTTLANIKHQQELERQENKAIIEDLKAENAQLVKKVEHLIGRVSRVDEFIEMWREEQKKPFWKRLFGK